MADLLSLEADRQGQSMLNYLHQLRALHEIEDEEEQRVEERRDLRAYASDFSLDPFTEVIPPCWREEVLEAPDSPLKQPVMYAIMQGFGSLACLLYTRMLRMCKENKDDKPLIRDLRLMFSVTLQTMKNLSLRRKAIY